MNIEEGLLDLVCVEATVIGLVDAVLHTLTRGRECVSDEARVHEHVVVSVSE